MRTNLFVLATLALFAGCAGCGNPEDTDTVDTGVADADTDTDADSDSDSDADFEATVNGVAEVEGDPTLNIPGATCNGATCEVDKPGKYEGKLEAPDYLFVPQTIDVTEPGEYTLPFTGEGQYGQDLTGSYEGDMGHYDVESFIDGEEVTVDLDISGQFGVETGSGFFYEDAEERLEGYAYVNDDGDVEIYYYQFYYKTGSELEDIITRVGE